MGNKHKELTNAFAPTQIGAITSLIEPVTANNTFDVLKTYFDEDHELTSYPIEKNGGVVGLISREIMSEGNKSVWNKIRHKELDSYINKTVLSIDARVHIDKIFQKISSSDNPFEDLLVFHRGRYFGVLSIKKLLKQISFLRSRELTKAKDLQHFFVQKNVVKSQFFEYNIFWELAHDLGGDFYQTIQLSDNHFLLSLFDVSGKDVTASLTTSFLVAFFATLKQENLLNKKSDREIVESLNNMIFEVTPNDHFVTGVLFFIDTETKNISIYNMGFSPVYLFTPEEKTMRLKIYPPNFPPLGIGTIPEAGENIFAIKQHMKVIAYSDGLTDIKDPEGFSYEDENLKNFICENYKESLEDFSSILQDELNSFRKTAPLADDMSLLHIKFT